MNRKTALSATLALALIGSPLLALALDITPHRGCKQQDPNIYAKVLKRSAKRWNLDLGLLMGLIQTESRFDAGATSRTGAAGLGQFTGIGVKEIVRLAKMSRYSQAYRGDTKLLEGLRNFSKDKAYEPIVAVEATALFLHHLVRSYDNNVEAALTHYNAGGRMARLVVEHGFKEAHAQGLLTYSQAKTYAPHVLEWRKKFRAGWHPFGKSSRRRS